MRDAALQDDSPCPVLACTGLGEIQAGKWNAQEHDVSGRRAFTPGVPHGVEGVVGAALLAVKTVSLNAECIAAKQERPPLVVEGVEHHLNRIIVSQRIARQHVTSNKIRPSILANESDKEIFAREAEISGGGLGNRSAVRGITLDEVGDAQHGACRFGAHRSDKKIAERGLTLQAWNSDMGLLRKRRSQGGRRGRRWQSTPLRKLRGGTHGCAANVARKQAEQ